MKRLLLAASLLLLPISATAQIVITPSRAASASGGAGTGDVVGPGSATDNALSCFDGTTGKLLKECAATVSGTNTGDQNVFTTIAVSGQSNVVSDAASDTLTIIAGTNVTITTSAGGDSITINSTASGTGDVVGPASATNNDFACFDTTTGKLLKDCTLQSSAFLLSSTSSTQNGYFGDLRLRDDTNPSHYMIITNADDLSADRILSLNLNNAARTIDLGGNLTVTGAATLSGSNSGDQNLFSSIPVSGQTTVSASGPTTALTLIAGTNVTITTDNTAKSITITAASGGTGCTVPGSDKSVIFNDGGAACGADSGITYDKTTDSLTLAGRVIADGPTFAVVAAKTANYTLTTSDFFVPFDATSGALTATLPSAATSGLILIVKKVDSSANDVTIDPTGSQTVDDLLTIALTEQGDSLMMQADGSNWKIIAEGTTGIAAPSEDSLYGYDFSAGHKAFFTFGSGITVTGTVISVSGGGGAPTDSQYWTGAADAGLSAEKNLGALGTALVINTAGVPSAYAGSTCTNQAVTAISAVGAATCTTLSSAYVGTSIWTGTATSGLLKASSQGVLTTATAGTDYTTTGSTTDFTGKTYDTEGTGNVFKDRVIYEWTAGVTQASTASAGFNLPASNPCAATDGSATAVFATCNFDAATDEFAQFHFKLPSWFNSAGAVDVIIDWYNASASGNSARLCTNTTAKIAGDPMGSFTFDDETCTDFANDSTGNDLNQSTLSGIDVSDWAANAIAFMQVSRDANHANDNLAGDVRIVGIQVIFRVTK